MMFDKLHEKQSQSGRTITEMVGVLILIGILLMGALRGMQWSTDRLHANELGNEIMQRAADVKMQLDRPRATVKWSKWEAKSHTGCPIEFSQNTEEVTIQVLNVKQRVCEMVLSDLSHLEGASRVEGACQSSANNTLIFYFDKLGTKRRIKGVDCFCDDPKVCDENGDCVCPEDSPIGYEADTCACPDYLMPIKGKCLCEDETEPVDGKCGNCSTDEDCDGGLTCENHTCTCIAKECSESDFTDTLCACCPVETPKWDETEGVCKTCADIDINLPVYNKETKTCEACPDNKVWDGVSGQCVECVVDTDCADSGFVCTNNVCECAEGTSTPCSSNLIQTTNTSKYNQICYLCRCPTDSTMSGDTCVCNNECQTYNTSTKTCTNKANGTVCTNGLCSNGTCVNDACPSGTVKTCSANLVATASSKTAYGTQCYTCGCPSGSTLSSDGTTCVCNDECQTYNASTKTCVSKTDGTTCSTGLCKTGICTNDTCTTGVKTCGTNYTSTQVSTTAYGTACYQCCASPKVWNGTACACPSGTPTYANASTCACNSGETNQNGVCTPELYSPCATYCRNGSSGTTGSGDICSSVTSLQKINVTMSLQYNVAVNGSRTYQLVVVGTNRNTGYSITNTVTLGSGTTTFETACGAGQATMYSSYVKIYTNDTGCDGLIQGWTTCYFEDAKELSNAQKTTCNPFCSKYASRYGW
ncbi:MAG: type II secretion system protein [Alphaproteobacteria bacterium]|nr:type II secretion system protein [Alphaproteobacteria bacterium]